MKKIFCVGLLLGLVSFQTGCAAKARVTNIDNTFLTDVDIKHTLPNLPFQHAWVRPGIDKKQYVGFYLKPVRTDLLPKDAWLKSASPFIVEQRDFEDKAQEIAKYFYLKLKEEMKENLPPQFLVMDEPMPGAIVIEIAITELEFSHPVARTAALAAPVPGTGAALSTVTDPHVAFAARLTDARDGTLLATAADRKFPPVRIIDLNKLTVSSSAREICALWATSMTEAMKADKFTKVEEKKFSLGLW